MASATVETELVEKISYVEQKTVTLTLTEYEAKVLAAALFDGFVWFEQDGDTDDGNTVAGAMNHTFAALNRAGVDVWERDQGAICVKPRRIADDS